MNPIPTCLTNIVGVSETTCPCPGGTPLTGDTTSKSGLFLDSLVDMRKMIEGGRCDGQTAWDVGRAAIKEATQLFTTNLVKCWGERHQQRPVLDVFVGEVNFRGNMNPGAPWVGVQLLTNPAIEHGEVLLKGITTAFNADGVIEVFCYDSLTETALWSVELNTTANLLQPNPLAGGGEVLPFKANGSEAGRYWLIYQPGALQPKDAECFCECNSKRAMLSDWIEVTGTKGSAVDRNTRLDWTRDNFNYGLFLDLTVRCNAQKDICDGELQFGFDGRAGVIAEAVWFLAASVWCRNVLNSGRMSLYTAWDTELIAKNEVAFAQEAGARVKNLCETAAPGACYICRDDIRMSTMNF